MNTYLAWIEVRGKVVKAAYDPKKRKAYMLNDKGQQLEQFLYEKFKFIRYLETENEDYVERKTSDHGR